MGSVRRVINSSKFKWARLTARRSIKWILLGVFLLDELGNCLQLDVRRPLVDRSLLESEPRLDEPIVKAAHYFRVPPEFLNPCFSRETDTTSPFYRLPADLLCNDTGVVLGHRSLLGEGLAFIPSPSSIIGHQPRSFKFGSSLGDGKSHALESSNRLPELVSLVCVRNSLVESSLSEPDHLRRDSNST